MRNVNTVLPFPARGERRNFLEEELRKKARDWIEVMLQEELESALGIGRYERGSDRKGYRNGSRERSFTTGLGFHKLNIPRGVYFEPGPEGKKEFNSQLIPRYAHRSDAVEESLVKSYLCGTNTRKIRHALSPLLEGAALSSSTVSRVVSRLSDDFEAWKRRDLSADDIAIIFFDGFMLKMRFGGKVESVPVLCAIGVRADGSKVLLALDVRASESSGAWRAFAEDLAERGVKAPVLAVIDGNKGLNDAVKSAWPRIDVQRCTKHKIENLYTHAPKRHHKEVKADYDLIIHADGLAKARKAWRLFERKWEKSCPAVVNSLREGGDELLTFFTYPSSTWKSLRTTNCIERMNGEFRRRVKTQGSFPDIESGLKLLYGLFASGLISMQRLHGWRDLPAAVAIKRMEKDLMKKVDKAA